MGDTFIVTAGCDKRFATCRDRFDNAVNFRGFPHIPGNDFVVSYPVQGEPGNNGGSLFVAMADLNRQHAHARGHRRRGARWIGTPYRHQASLKGVGCDCLGLVRGVWRAVYRRRAGTRAALCAGLGGGARQESLAAAAARHLVAIERDEIEPGDVLLFRWRAHLPPSTRPLSPRPQVVHAHDGAAVTEVVLAPWWRRRLALRFAFRRLID